ncbi:MAG: galactokinase [Clostridia bacterium]|nr:galactokinase [Clostridia bacterium]
MAFDKIFESNEFDRLCHTLYGDFSHKRKVAYKALSDMHEKAQGKEPEAFYSASGRIEIVGNHTDHNGGKVLCSAVTIDTLGAVSRRDDGLILVKSKGYPIIKVSVNDLDFKIHEIGSSQAIIKGILAYFKGAGAKIGGFNAYTSSSVPKGSGVSSSSAFELLIAEILNDLYNDGSLDKIFKAKASQYAECAYFGKPCGLMDQSAISLGGVNMIDFKSFENPIVSKAEWKFDDLDIYVIATGGDHCDLTDDYASIPNEMRQVADLLGGKILVDVPSEKFFKEKENLKGRVSERALLRAEHFYEENIRVDRAYNAINNGDEKGFLDAVNESGLSSRFKLQNLYSPKSKSHLIEEALDKTDGIEGVVAKRVHGGGFAGTILVFVKKDSSNDANEQFKCLFGENNVFKLSVRPCGAMRVL